MQTQLLTLHVSSMQSLNKALMKPLTLLKVMPCLWLELNLPPEAISTASLEVLQAKAIISVFYKVPGYWNLHSQEFLIH